MFDAGAIMAHLDIETGQFDRKLTAAESRIHRLEHEPHQIRLDAVFNNASLGRARQIFTQLDQQLSREAMMRLRSSPQGSVLGALNALFSPHPVTGGPSPQQSATQGLLGRMVGAQGGGMPGRAGPGMSSVLLGQAAGTGPAGTARVKIDNISDLADAISNGPGQAPSGPDPGTARAADNTRRAAEASERSAASSADAARSAASAAQDSSSATHSFLRGFLGIGGGAAGQARNALGQFIPGGGGRGGGRGATGFITAHAGPLSAGLAGGIGPGILGIGGIRAGIAGLIGTGVAALPALAAVGGAGALLGGGAGLLAAGTKSLIGTQNVKGKPPTQGPLFAQAQQVKSTFEGVFKGAAAELEGPLKAVFSDLPGMLRGIAPALHQAFAGAATLIGPLVDGLNDLAHMILPLLGSAFRALAPLVNPLIDGLGRLVAGILPGLTTLLRAAGPAVTAFSNGLADIGAAVGNMLSTFAPVVQASSTILSALFDVLAGLFPIIGTLAQVFARTLAPIFVQLAGIIRSLMPFLVTLGKLFASLAGAILGDLVSAFGALAQLLSAISPALNAFATAFSQVFTVLENSGVFAVIGDALEALVKPLGTMISQLLNGLTPLLPPIISFLGQMSSILVRGLAAAVAAVLPPLTQLATVALGLLARFLPPILPLITELAGQLSGQLARAVIQLAPALTQLATVALQSLAVILPVILPLITELARLFTDALAGTIHGVAVALSGIVSAIPPSVLQALTIGALGLLAAFKAWAIVKGIVTGIRAVFETARIAILVFYEDTALAAVKSAASAVVTAARWLAAGAVIVGSFIAQAAAATAAFIAENLATLGIIAGIALLVGAIIYLATHWSQVWGEIKRLANDAWRFLNGLFRNRLVQDILAVWTLGLLPLAEHWSTVWRNIRNWANDARGFLSRLFRSGIVQDLLAIWSLGLVPLFTHWSSVFGGFKRVASDFWGWLSRVFGSDVAGFFTRTLPGWFSTAVTKIGQFWGGIEHVIEAPVKWVFQHVLNPLASGFDWITSHLGLGNPIPVPLVKGFARGGRITGGIPGVDSVLGLLQQDEVVIPRHMVRAGLIDHLRGMLPGFQAGGRVRVGQPPPVNLHTGTGTGGQTGNPLSGLLRKIEDMAKISAALATGNSSALVNAFSDFTGMHVPGAGGDMARVLTAIPKTLVKDISNWLFGKAGGTSGNSIVRYAMSFLGRIPYVWGGTAVPGGADCSGFTEAVYRHFGINAPRTSEEQGAWVRRSGAVPGGLAFFNSPAGGSPPGHVAIIRDGSMVISQGGGMGPQLMPLTGALPLMWTGVPPGGFGTGGIGNVAATGPIQQFARRLVDATWPGTNQWIPFADIVRRESGWRVNATNPASGAYGIPQALPGSKMASAGADWRTNPYTQIRWMVGYLKSKWGSPVNADNNEIVNHWYRNGGAIREPVIGYGTQSGDRYHIAENGTEWVSRTPPGSQVAGAGAMIGTVYIQLPEGQTVSRALSEMNFWLSVAAQQGYAGVLPGG